MFVQVIQGKVENAVALRSQWLRWDNVVRPEAIGFLGATAGITDDGRFIAMARFESERAARENDARPEQREWWATTVAQLDDVVVRDTNRTDTWNRGVVDDAGFVQIRQGVSNAPQRLRELYVDEQPVRMGPHRPEVLGGIFAWHDDGAFTLSACFTSEAEARRGENRCEFGSFFADISAVMQDVEYFDLHDPWVATASAVVAA